MASLPVLVDQDWAILIRSISFLLKSSTQKQYQSFWYRKLSSEQQFAVKYEVYGIILCFISYHVWIGTIILLLGFASRQRSPWDNALWLGLICSQNPRFLKFWCLVESLNQYFCKKTAIWTSLGERWKNNWRTALHSALLRTLWLNIL